MVKYSFAWAGFWIMIGLIVAASIAAHRIDCYLGVPNSCEKLADAYKVEPA